MLLPDAKQLRKGSNNLSFCRNIAIGLESVDMSSRLVIIIIFYKILITMFNRRKISKNLYKNLDPSMDF